MNPKTCQKCGSSFYILNENGLCDGCFKLNELDIIRSELEKNPNHSLISLAALSLIPTSRILEYVKEGLINFREEQTRKPHFKIPTYRRRD